jgi:hypothetical protein
MAQLTFREGTLSLNAPLRVATISISVTDQIKQLLNTEHLSEMILILKSAPNIRVKLSETEIRWIEKTKFENRDYRFLFETQTLLFNDAPADPSFRVSFSQKMDHLRTGITQNKIQILGKKAKRSD